MPVTLNVQSLTDVDPAVHPFRLGDAGPRHRRPAGGDERSAAGADAAGAGRAGDCRP